MEVMACGQIVNVFRIHNSQHMLLFDLKEEEKGPE